MRTSIDRPDRRASPRHSHELLQQQEGGPRTGQSVRGLSSSVMGRQSLDMSRAGSIGGSVMRAV